MSAFFIVFSLHGSTFAATLGSNGCQQFRATETVTIEHVHDGDTVILSDKRKVRLIGIDTPELARQRGNKHFPAQPFAEQARDFVRDLLKNHGATVRLMAGNEQQDRYGRYLFHIQLSNNKLIQSALLKQGLAVAFATTPNTRLLDCYQQQEKIARDNLSGFWSHPKYRLILARNLSVETKGFHRIQATVTHIGESKKAYWLNTRENFSVRLDKRDLKHFDKLPAFYLHKTIITRGWLKQYNGRFHLPVRHPSAIETILAAD